jgi:hypothetical protein
MPYARALNKLKPLIEEAVKSDEMLDGMADADISRDALTAEIEGKSERIFESVGGIIKDFDEMERRHSQLWYVGVLQDVMTSGALALAAICLLTLARYGYDYYVSQADASVLQVVWAALRAGWASWLPYVFAGSVLMLFVVSRVSPAFNRAELDSLRARRDELKDKIEKGLVQAIQAEGRAVFERLIVPSFETKMKVVKAPGLAEVPGASRAVDTRAREDLRELLKMMPGGSIGIAGPRGAGKTTLIWEYCCGAVAKLKDRPVLGVMTSAPVEYEARDFILYIFLSVCRAVLKEFGADLNSPPWLADAGPLARFDQREYRLAAIALSVFGYGLITSSIALGTLSDLNRDGLGVLKAIGITPLQLFVTGMLLILPITLVVLRRLLTMLPPKKATMMKNVSHSVGAANAERYVQKAWGWMKMIKFQQSFTSGWSGALKLPVGLEGNVNRAASLAENQKSLPEIVGGLREFLGDLAQDFQVVVGIDELDKLESDETAQRFVNEIKSVFGLERCFYLVSVSESAMTNFERRGLPFRDAFDSSFDNIVKADYLKLEEARQLIARRVIGMPMPFRDLCFCLSGGLARDLIRSCRNLVQMAPGGGDLSELCDRLIREDVRSKVQAVITSAGKVELEPEGSDFIAALYRLESASDEGRDMLAECAALNVRLTRSLSADKEEAKLLAARRLQLAALGKELTTYVYYSDTLLRYFGPDYHKLSAAEASGERGSLNYLARARQSLSVNPAVAKSIIDDFRSARELPVEHAREMAPEAGDVPALAQKTAGPANGDGSPAAALLIAGTPATLQKSIEGLKRVLEGLVNRPEEG